MSERMSSVQDRDDVEFWVRQIDNTIADLDPVMVQFARYARWYTGDMRDLERAEDSSEKARYEASIDNLHAFITDTAVASMFFRNPRPVISCPDDSGGGIWSPGLAECETALTRDTLDQAGYFLRARRRLLHARLGPFGVLKIGYERDIAIDKETVDEHRIAANDENRNWLAAGIRMTASPDQLHSVHIEEHEKLLAMAQRGELPLPKKQIKYLRDHIRKHEEMRHAETPTEWIRDASVTYRCVNPLNFFYDTSVDDIADARWSGETYMARYADVKANKEFNAKAREEIVPQYGRWQRKRNQFNAGIRDTYLLSDADPMVRLYEIVDLVDGVVRTYADGCSKMLSVKPYTLKLIMPSGPYSILCLKQHPFEASGVPCPTGWAEDQKAVTDLANMQIRAAMQSEPKTLVDGTLSEEEVAKINEAPQGAWVRVTKLPDQKMEQMFAPAPVPQLTQQLLEVYGIASERAKQRSGFGTQKLGGGDTAGSATEAAIVAGASDAISQDQANLIDIQSSYDVRLTVRLQRAFYPKTRVEETVGPRLANSWPEFWSDRDIRNDRNVGVVPGSSRRLNTEVQAKILADFLATAAPMPMYQGPAGQKLILEAHRRIVENQGIAGLDWDGVSREIEMQAAMAMQAQAAMAGGGGMPPEDGGDATEDQNEGGPRPSEMTEASMSGQMQGMANVGGGRLATGASTGDTLRMLRGGVG